MQDACRVVQDAAQVPAGGGGPQALQAQSVDPQQPVAHGQRPGAVRHGAALDVRDVQVLARLVAWQQVQNISLLFTPLHFSRLIL